MRFKLIMALVDDHHVDYSERRPESRRHGRDGRHERPRRGITPEKTFLKLEIAGHRDPMMFLLIKQMRREILETIAKAGEFDQKPGSGIAFQIAI